MLTEPKVGHDVGELVALEQPVHAAHVHEARRAHVHLVGRAAAVADEVEAELAVRRLVRRVDLARRAPPVPSMTSLKWLISDSISV